MHIKTDIRYGKQISVEWNQYEYFIVWKQMESLYHINFNFSTVFKSLEWYLNFQLPFFSYLFVIYSPWSYSNNMYKIYNETTVQVINMVTSSKKMK
jgi:hypothetical protein